MKTIMEWRLFLCLIGTFFDSAAGRRCHHTAVSIAALVLLAILNHLNLLRSP